MECVPFFRVLPRLRHRHGPLVGVVRCEFMYLEPSKIISFFTGNRGRMWQHILVTSLVAWNVATTLPYSQKKIWKHFETRPSDPALSCHLLSNNTWSCAPDFLLVEDVTPDDSY